MLQAFFHAWERGSPRSPKIASSVRSSGGSTGFPTTATPPAAPPADVIGDYVSQVMADTDAFFTPPPTTDYTLTPAADGDLLTFPSALTTPHESNNTVRCRYFRRAGDAGRPARARGGAGDAAVELRRGRARRACASCSRGTA